MLMPAKITINPLLPRRPSSGVNGATVVSVEKLPDFFMADGSEISRETDNLQPETCNTNVTSNGTSDGRTYADHSGNQRRRQH